MFVANVLHQETLHCSDEIIIFVEIEKKLFQEEKYASMMLAHYLIFAYKTVPVCRMSIKTPSN